MCNILAMDISGATVKAYREQLALSQLDLAEAIDVSQTLISAVELGRAAVSRKLLKKLRIAGDEGVLSPTFAEFLEGGGVAPRPEEAEFQVVRPIPLEPWGTRVNLAKPADAGVPDRIWVPGITEEARAFRFTPPPALLAPDSAAIFVPCELGDLAPNQLVLAQFRKGVDVGVGVGAHMGRALVSRHKRATICQVEFAEFSVPVATLSADELDVLMMCHFRGRHGRP